MSVANSTPGDGRLAGYRLDGAAWPDRVGGTLVMDGFI